jgi:GNAT superfamily N-acetyltransferase
VGEDHAGAARTGPIDLRAVRPEDQDDLFAAYTQIVEAGDGFPHAPPLSRADFDDYWLRHSSAVWIVRVAGQLAGAYYVKPNFVGRAAHISNAGYFVLEPFRRRGLGRSLVEHSLREARRLGFDAMQFNLVFASNPARSMYRALGFVEIGQIPAAVDGDDAVIYWRSLTMEDS